jgi:hypothetical protein
MNYFEIDALIALVMISGICGFFLGKHGLAGSITAFQTDISNIKADIQNLKVVTLPITPTVNPVVIKP